MAQIRLLTGNDAMRVPQCAGVYVITNTVTGAMYIGAARMLRRRYRNWRKAATTRSGPNRHMLKELTTAPREAWVFVVLASGDMDDAEMFRLEALAVSSAAAKGARLLNLSLTRYPRR